VVGLAGCGGDDATSTAESGTLVTYARTGGFASMPVSLEIQDDGSATVVAGVDPARESFEVDPDELEELRSELDGAVEDFEPPAVPSGCNDCYVYEATYHGSTISYDESQEVPASITAAVAHLSQIADAHYPPEADEPPIVN
jgi:hypothetical protein